MLLLHLLLLIILLHFQQYCSTGRQRAVKYLERQLYRITDTYEVAIVTYALAKVRLLLIFLFDKQLAFLFRAGPLRQIQP